VSTLVAIGPCSGCGEEIDMQVSNRQTDGRTMDDQESSPTELKISTILSRIPHLRTLFSSLNLVPENRVRMQKTTLIGQVFSSPELKAQVSFSDRPLSGVRLSVCELLHFRLLLQNHWTNFNQTWHKSS
jgi:hypothetical protein